jgi:hypothetical protein
MLPCTQGSQRNDQFGELPKRRVDQAADHIAGLGRYGFCGPTK